MSDAKTSKKRRSKILRFSTDPKVAAHQREMVTKAAKIRGYDTNENGFIVTVLLDACQKIIDKHEGR